MSKLTPSLEGMLRRDGEAGQAIVLVALFMLVLVGMLGLAIDGGGLFLLYRDARNAADTAALQAAYARCTSPIGSTEYKTAGLNAADENGFRNGGISTITVDDYSVITGDTADAGKTYVNITAEKPSYFANLVFSGPLIIEVNAVAFCDRGFDPSEESPGAIARAAKNTCGGSNTEFDWSASETFFDGVILTYGEFDPKAKVWMTEDSRFLHYGDINFSGANIFRTAATKDDRGDTSRPAIKYCGATASSDFTCPTDPEDSEDQDYLMYSLGNISPVDPLPDTAVLSDFAPGGPVYDYLDNHASGIVTYVPGSIGSVTDITNVNSNAVDGNGWVQGLIVTDGDIILNGNDFNNYAPDVSNTYYYTNDGNDWDYTDFEDAFTGQNGDATWAGATFISLNGSVKIKMTGTFLRYYEGLGGFVGSEGLADEISTERNYPLIVNGAGRVNTTCSTTNNDVGIDFGNEGYLYGLVWVANGRMNIQFSDASFRGALDGNTIDYQGARGNFWHDPSVFASSPPSVGQES